MKTLSKYFTIIFILSAVLFSSCDYVKNPVEPKAITVINVAPVVDSTSVHNQTDTTVTTITRKIFVEDYTGHKCDNCPRAARTLHKLKDSTYHENMVIVSIHAGGFTSTTPLPTGEQFPTDMTTPTGNDYYNLPDFGFISNPAFMVDRKDVPTQNNYVSESGLASASASAFGLAPEFKLQIYNTFDTIGRTLKSKVKVTALSSASSSIYKVVILLIEDSIVAEQLDKYVVPNYVPNYVHRDVLRAAINSTWGEQVFATGIAINGTAYITAPNFNVNSNYKAKRCKVVAFIYDANSSSTRNYEVLQAEELKIW